MINHKLGKTTLNPKSAKATVVLRHLPYQQIFEFILYIQCGNVALAAPQILINCPTTDELHHPVADNTT